MEKGKIVFKSSKIALFKDLAEFRWGDLFFDQGFLLLAETHNQIEEVYFQPTIKLLICGDWVEL